MWDEITHTFANFNGAAVDVCEWISNFIAQSACDYLSILGLKITRVRKGVPDLVKSRNREASALPRHRFKF